MQQGRVHPARRGLGPDRLPPGRGRESTLGEDPPLLLGTSGPWWCRAGGRGLNWVRALGLGAAAGASLGSAVTGTQARLDGSQGSNGQAGEAGGCRLSRWPPRLAALPPEPSIPAGRREARTKHPGPPFLRPAPWQCRAHPPLTAVSRPPSPPPAPPPPPPPPCGAPSAPPGHLVQPAR